MSLYRPQRRQFAALAMAPWLAACGPRPAVRLGFLGDMSGRGGDFSAEARDGVLLGVEQRNAAAGADGERWELLTQDYGGGTEREVAAVQALLGAGVRIIIGPYASPIALRMLPYANARGVVLLGPTINGDALAGRDDYLVCLNLPGSAGARHTARMLRRHGWEQAALACDLRNTAYSQAWSREFRAAFVAAGGAIGDEVAFGVDPGWSFLQVAQQLLQNRPRGLVFVANSMDAARLAQQVAKLARGLPLAAAGWAASPDLIEIGGGAVEGMVLAQPYDRSDRSARFLAFQAAYRARFEREPNYSALASYDAVAVVAQARARARRHESLRDALLRHGPYDGVQDRISLNRFGDVSRPTYFTIVRNGRFELVP